MRRTSSFTGLVSSLALLIGLMAGVTGLSGCQGDDGNPSRGSISAPRGKEGGAGATNVGEDFKGAKTKGAVGGKGGSL